MDCWLVQAEGGIPCNTADLLKEQEFAQKVTVADHEGVEGTVNFKLNASIGANTAMSCQYSHAIYVK
jgi:hypothetical protein